MALHNKSVSRCQRALSFTPRLQPGDHRRMMSGPTVSTVSAPLVNRWNGQGKSSRSWSTGLKPRC